jgi:hypothetical protein
VSRIQSSTIHTFPQSSSLPFASSPSAALPGRRIMLPKLRVGLPAVVSKWCQMPPRQPLTDISLPRIRLIYAEYERVTDGARTHDLRSHK